MAPLSVGDVAPSFRTRNTHGETVGLDDLLDGARAALLVFYPWAFSGICTGELAALEAERSTLEAAGVRVAALSCDAMFSLRAFADAEALSFDLLTDHWPHGAIATAYGVFDPVAGCGLRGSFLVGTDGRIAWTLTQGIGERRDIGAHVRAATA